MRKLSLLITVLALVLAVFALTGCGSDDDDDAAGGSVTVELSEESGSGQTGTATLTGDGEQTSVSIPLDGEPVSDSQPAHIHEGRCGDELSPELAFGLPAVSDATSAATVEAPLETLQARVYDVIRHMSADDLPT